MNTNRHNTLLALLVLAVSHVAIGCSGSSGSDEPPQRLCQINGTGQIRFENRGSAALMVVLGGSSIGPIEARQKSSPQTIPAGVHRVEVRFADSGKPACQPSDVTVGACDDRVVYCQPDTPPPCKSAGTATLRFENRAKSTRYDVVLDGKLVATLTPGARSDARTVPAGAHTLEFRFAGSSRSACAPRKIAVAACQTGTWWCANEDNCRTRRTGRVRFVNGSRNATYRVYVNKTITATLGPGEQSSIREFPAGRYTVEFRYAHDNRVACSGTAELAVCANRVWSCSKNR